MRRRITASAFLVLTAICCVRTGAPAEPPPVRFVILGDRTGDERPGVYARVLREATAEHPDFIVSVGDSIQGLQDATAGAEWQRWERMMEPFRKIPIYLTAGNHDIWSSESERLYLKYSGHPLHYSFDSGPVHIAVLDNSRSEALSTGELAFLQQDLEAHRDKPVKLVISHRPSWVLKALTRDPDFPLHQLARKYGVEYVVAGHIHQMLHYSLEGVEYVSMPSSGGHLRDSAKPDDGWIFGYAVVEVVAGSVKFRIHELDGKVTSLNDWGPVGRR